MNTKQIAKYFEKLENNTVKCLLCSHQCIISNGKKGFCKSRINENGVLYTLNYGKACAINLDPIEKKPLYHFLPSTKILSLGTNFCNFACKFCQNYEISQYPTQLFDISFEQILYLVKSNEQCFSVAFTYNEPTIWYEFILDCAKFLKQNNIKVVLVTNGDISKEAFLELIPYIDAMNIDLKAYDENFYKNICSGSLKTVCQTIELAYTNKIIVEITNLLIPTLNDSNEMITNLVNYISSLSSDIPLHFSKYHPAFKMNINATPYETLVKAYEIAKHKLKYVYLGNVYDVKHSSTYCPNCSTLLISREYFNAKKLEIQNNMCSKCKTLIYGLFNL